MKSSFENPVITFDDLGIFHLAGWKVFFGSKVDLRLGQRVTLPETVGLEIFSDGNREIFSIRFPSGAAFSVSLRERTVFVSARSDTKHEHLEHLLADQVAPRILAHLGQLVVHSAGVAIDGSVALFVGKTGRGKSTLSASLKQSGYKLLGDDAIVLTCGVRACLAEAVYPSLRLNIDSIEYVIGKGLHNLEPGTGGGKARLDALIARSREPNEVPLGAIFFLGDGEGSGGPCVTAISPATACMRIIEHSFWLDPHDVARASDKLIAASCIATKIPAFELNFARNFELLCNVHDEIFKFMN